jgi:hypothetical protein
MILSEEKDGCAVATSETGALSPCLIVLLSSVGYVVGE